MQAQAPEQSQILKSIWLLENSPADANPIVDALSDRYRVSWISSVAQFQAAWRDASALRRPFPALLVSEVQLADGCLVDIRVDRSVAVLPTFIVTTQSELSVIRSFLRQGVQDYLVKPIECSLLLAKISHFMEGEDAQGERAALGLSLNPYSLEIQNQDGRAALLTPKEFQVFSSLYEVFPEGVTRDQIVRSVWSKVNVVSWAVDVHLSNLRKKLEPLGTSIWLRDKAKYALAPIASR